MIHASNKLGDKHQGYIMNMEYSTTIVCTIHDKHLGINFVIYIHLPHHGKMGISNSHTILNR